MRVPSDPTTQLPTLWTRERIAEDLRTLRILPGDALIVHASLRAIGTVEGGPDAVLEALREVVGPEGTILAPAFNRENYAGEAPDAGSMPAEGVCVDEVGALAARVAYHPDAARSDHPVLSFAALGPNAAFLTDGAPYHYPFGTNSPLARLHRLNGGILLIGVGHERSAALCLAEVWADAPYARRLARVKTGPGAQLEMEGAPGCMAGFGKIEPVLRQARILKTGYVGNAPSQYMRVQHVVSMAIEMLRGDPECLLCDDEGCRACALARRFAEKAR